MPRFSFTAFRPRSQVNGRLLQVVLHQASCSEAIDTGKYSLSFPARQNLSVIEGRELRETVRSYRFCRLP